VIATISPALLSSASSLVPPWLSKCDALCLRIRLDDSKECRQDLPRSGQPTFGIAIFGTQIFPPRCSIFLVVWSRDLTATVFKCGL